MKLVRIWMVLLTYPAFAAIYHVENAGDDSCFEWHSQTLNPLTEAIVSWDADRPEKGRYLISVSFDGSEWLPYAEWGQTSQRTFQKRSLDGRSSVFQDAAMPGGRASSVAVRIEALEGANLSHFRRFHLYANEEVAPEEIEKSYKESYELAVVGQSQITLFHPRALSLCSPTSTSAVIGFLNDCAVDPVEFAECVHDSEFDIYGNWILNTAEASHRLGPMWQCWVERLAGPSALLDALSKGYPTVVSIRGPLTGSALPYASGHLVVVTGFDALTDEILCMDPAFPKNELTHVRYPLEEFVAAWSRRGYVAYLFARVDENDLR